MISKHSKIFTSLLYKIGCINQKVVVSMVVFIILYVALDLKPILVLKALLPKLINLLQEKIYMMILKPLIALYSN